MIISPMSMHSSVSGAVHRCLPQSQYFLWRAPRLAAFRQNCTPKAKRKVALNAVVPPEKEEGGGTGVIEKPGFDRSKEESTVIPDNFYGSTESPPGAGLGGGDWRVMLLDSPTHSEELVVRVLTTVVGSVDEQQAKNCFSTSKQLGQALIISCLKEHAEFFTQMINRQGVRSIIEPDTTTM